MMIKMPDPKDDPKSSEWRPYIFARDQWHCRICGDRFLYSEMVRKHIANEHNETMPPSMYEYFHGAVVEEAIDGQCNTAGRAGSVGPFGSHRI
jgi:hypothetical protein